MVWIHKNLLDLLDSLPDVDVAVDGEPRPLHLREQSHHAVALHVAKVLHQLGRQRHPLHTAHLPQAVQDSILSQVWLVLDIDVET